MIDILKKMLHEGLAEMEIKQKDLFGSGMEHKIFPSKDPNKLFKVGYCHSVKLFIKAATKNNKYFPIVYKIGDMMYKGERVCWVLIEKLNTDKAIADRIVFVNQYNALATKWNKAHPKSKVALLKK